MLKRVVQLASEPEVKLSICLLWSYLIGCLDLCLYKQDCTIKTLNADIDYFVGEEVKKLTKPNLSKIFDL